MIRSIPSQQADKGKPTKHRRKSTFPTKTIPNLPFSDLYNPVHYEDSVGTQLFSKRLTYCLPSLLNIILSHGIEPKSTGDRFSILKRTVIDH
ncbi:MAG: hypothetical protein P8M80_17560 [Pirellulaceae bacterium]|nr:hypothetical protein [Pirellulaceae bacterium]